MSWYCISLGPEQVEFGFVNIVRAEMEEIWISRGGQEHFSVWLKEDEMGSHIYFSPVAAGSASMVIFRFGGVSCSEPDKSELTFLLGYAYRDDTP